MALILAAATEWAQDGGVFAVGWQKSWSSLAGGGVFCDRTGMRKGKREFSVVVERDEDGFYVASVPELPGCHTQARSLDKLMDRIREAIELCLEVDHGGSARTEFIGVQRVAV